MESYKLEMERTRLLCYNIFNASPNRTKSYSLTEFMPFQWDNSTQEVKVMSTDEVASYRSFFDQIQQN